MSKKIVLSLILILLTAILGVTTVVKGLTDDIAVTEVSPRLVSIEGNVVSIDITVVNEGDSTETFDVDVFVDALSADSGLVGYWSFNEGSGKEASDSSGNDYDGVIQGATWVEGKFGKALSFDGVNDNVIAPNIPLYSRSFTVAMWVNAEALPEHPVDSPLLTQLDVDSLGKYLHIVIRDSTPYFGFWIDDLTGNTKLSTEEWYHLSFVYDHTSNVKYIYVNGVFDASIQSMGAYQGLSGKTNIATYHGGGKTFEGVIDELRIYDRALVKEEIGDVANSGFIQTQTVTLTSGDSTTLTFEWSLSDVSPGNYAIKAVVHSLSGETDTDDNELASDTVKLIDSDVDGIVDVVDQDDDNDGKPDTEDAFPLDSSEWTDNDKDGTGDNADQDDDNDGKPDTEDAFPLDSSEWTDNDKDGTGDNADQDDDNDGMPDTWETEYGLNLLDPSDASLDTDGDGLTNIEEHQMQTNPKSYFSPFPTLTVGAVLVVVVILVAVIYLLKFR